MNITQFTKFCMIVVAIVAALVITVVGLLFGTVIEGTLFAEIAKWVFMGLCVIAILEGFTYFLAPLWWHFKIERRHEDQDN